MKLAETSLKGKCPLLHKCHVHLAKSLNLVFRVLGIMLQEQNPTNPESQGKDCGCVGRVADKATCGSELGDSKFA